MDPGRTFVFNPLRGLCYSPFEGRGLDDFHVLCAFMNFATRRGVESYLAPYSPVFQSCLALLSNRLGVGGERERESWSIYFWSICLFILYAFVFVFSVRELNI